MGSLHDYESRRIKRHITWSWRLIPLVSAPVIGRIVRDRIQRKVNGFGIREGTVSSVSVLIGSAQRRAAGERVCASCSRNAPLTEAVFLDELADAMVRSNQARYVTVEEAHAVLEKYPDNPLIISTVSGIEQEICRSYPKDCVYWNLKKKGFEF